MNQKLAIKILLWMVAALMVFHLLIVVQIVPYEITWGGRLKSVSEMYVFETASIGINLLFGLTLLIKGGFVKQVVSEKLVNAILWVFFTLFVLNTIGNVVAKTNFEKGFTIVTLGTAYLLWVILRSKKNQS